MMTFLLTWSILVRISFERRAERQKTNKTVTPKISALLIHARGDSCRCAWKFAAIFEQAADVQKVGNAIHRTNLYPPDSAAGSPQANWLNSDLSCG